MAKEGLGAVFRDGSQDNDFHARVVDEDFDAAEPPPQVAQPGGWALDTLGQMVHLLTQLASTPRW